MPRVDQVQGRRRVGSSVEAELEKTENEKRNMLHYHCTHLNYFRHSRIKVPICVVLNICRARSNAQYTVLLRGVDKYSQQSSVHTIDDDYIIYTHWCSQNRYNIGKECTKHIDIIEAR